jgi:hypothetical protein
MFDWLRRLKSTETAGAVLAPVLRAALRRNEKSDPVDIGPSDGCADHHSGASHCDVAPSCDGGGSHH